MIGVFDSGIGGLTVLDALRRRMPRRDFIYLADTARLPYGSKPPSSIRDFTAEIIDSLCDLGAEAIVIACNTASAAALPNIRLQCPVPLWGMVDATVEAATRAGRMGRVAVIATERTIASGVYQRKLEARGIRVWAQACPALVHAVEERSSGAEALLRDYLREIPRVDTLALGCTHFSLLHTAIERVVGPKVRVVDGAATLAGSVAAELDNEGAGRVRYLVTGDPARFARAGRIPRSLVEKTALAQVGRGVEVVHV